MGTGENTCLLTFGPHDQHADLRMLKSTALPRVHPCTSEG